MKLQEISEDSEVRGDMFFSKRDMKSESGQGTVEYILVLVVVVSLILGIVYQFNDAFRAYAKTYFGDYLACLLETGELPGSAPGGGGVTGATCATLYEPFSLATGKPVVSGGGGGGSGGNGASGKSDTSSSGKSSGVNDSSSSAGAKYTRAGGGGGSSGSSVSGRLSGSGGGGAGQGGGPSGPELYTGSDSNSIPGSALSGRRGGGASSQRQLEGDFYVAKFSSSAEASSLGGVMKGSTDSTGRTPDRMRVERRPASKDGKTPDDTEWTFGTYIRFMIIAAIIIALVLLIGGQALQISKGMES